MGVMFFEMCYRALTTGMERVQVLSNIRLPTIDFPEDFDEVEMPNQVVHTISHHFICYDKICLNCYISDIITIITLIFSDFNWYQICF